MQSHTEQYLTTRGLGPLKKCPEVALLVMIIAGNKQFIESTMN